MGSIEIVSLHTHWKSITYGYHWNCISGFSFEEHILWVSFKLCHWVLIGRAYLVGIIDNASLSTYLKSISCEYH